MVADRYCCTVSKAAAKLKPVQQECLKVLHYLTNKLGRAPTVAETSAALGLSRNGARAHIEALTAAGLYEPLPAVELKAKDLACLRAINALTARLGRSPSTREISAEMRMSAGGSRIHIARLVRFGLLTPPEMVLVMHITDAGKKFL